MGEDKIRIRAARLEDAENLLAVYAPYVEKTAVTFEYDVPSVEEFRRRIGKTLARYPYLVIEVDGEIGGTPMRGRSTAGLPMVGLWRLRFMWIRGKGVWGWGESFTQPWEMSWGNRGSST